MKRSAKSKILSCFLAGSMVLSYAAPLARINYAQDLTPYAEDFTLSEISDVYGNGQFVGNNNITWNYTTAKVQDNLMDGRAIVLKNATGSAIAVKIPNGINDFSFDAKKIGGDVSNRKMKVTFNGNVVKESEIFGTTPENQATKVSFAGLNLEGMVDVVIQMIGEGEEIPVAVDNVAWTNYEIPQVAVTPISTLRPILEGMAASGAEKTYTVEGVVTAVLGYGKNVFIQDSTGGIVVRLKASMSEIEIGKTIQATGVLKNYKCLGQIEVVSNDDVKVLPVDKKDVPVLSVTLADVNESVEGKLVQLKGLKAVTVPNSSNNYSITFNDVNGTKATVRMECGVKSSEFEVGKVYDVTGVVGQYSSSNTKSGYQIMPRTLADVAEVIVEDNEAPVIKHTPVAEGNLSKDLTIQAEITDNIQIGDTVLYYRVKGTEAFKELPMVVIENLYTAVIPKADLSLEGMQYYIKTTDKVNEALHPTVKDTYHEVKITDADIIGPTITKVTPVENATIPSTETKVGIRVEYNDPSGIKKESVKLFLNEVDVTTSATIADDAVSYAPETAPKLGDNKVRVVVEDNNGNSTTKEWGFFVGERSYNHYYGQLHSHTTLSDGQGSVDEAFVWARDNAKADFFAVTDHSNWFDNDLDWTKSERWKTLKDTANKYNDNGKYVALSGYEMTWSGSTGGWGHMNTFNTEWFESRTNKEMDLKAYYARIAQEPTSISQLNHPGKTFGDFADFSYYTEETDKVVHLLEVGNGEGPIRGSGYFPSFEYYTRALDKGWHVAPTINQDNHKANWVTANEGRTVVVSEQLERDALYNSMREKRVYATEDKNLEIMYKVNGQMMGSTLENAKTLSFDIDVKDPEGNDTIKKVSIIADGGRVVASQEFNSNVASWDLELPSQYTYYYVRVDQEDKDIAVTAPIWAGTSVLFGLSKLEVTQDPMLVGADNTFTATVYNNSNLPLVDGVVEFYVGSVEAGNKIGEAPVATLMPSSVGKVSINWKATVAGEQKIIATMKKDVNGTERIFSVDTSVLVGNANELPVILIDTNHYNAYVSGTYAGKIATLRAVSKENRFMLIENKQEITPEVLKGVKVLMLADPASKAKDHYVASSYSDSEVAAIKEFVEAGGSVIITSAADYGDASGEMGNAAQSNKVLEAIGSNIRFNDDQVIDSQENGGQPYRLYFSQHQSPLYGLTGNIPTGNKFSFYSGNSVILKENGDASKIDWLVNGHATTESSDADKAGDNTPVNKGEVHAMGAEMVGAGKVVACGVTFYSDFETETKDDAYSNLQMTMNILKWMIFNEDTKPKTIAEVRVDADNDGKLDMEGKKVSIEGRITAQSEAVTPKNAFFEVIYVQDETAGITVFGVSQTQLPLGTKVRITGTVGEYENDSQLRIENETKDIQILDAPVEIIAPKVMKTAEAMLETNEGSLVKVQGKVTKIVTEGDNALYINDGSGDARIYLNGYIGDGSGDLTKVGKWDSSIKVGDTVSAIGLAAEDMVGARIRVRNTSEIVKVSSGNSTVVPPVILPSEPVTVKKEESKPADKKEEPKQETPKGEEAKTLRAKLENLPKVSLGETPVQFKDVSNSWAGEYIKVLGSRGLVSGKSATEFDPKSQVTRGDFTKILMNVLNLEKKQGTALKDVQTTDYYFNEIQLANAYGLVKGADGLFNPKGSLTRQDMMVILYRAMKVKNIGFENKSSLENYKDASKVSGYAQEAVAYLVGEGVIQGSGNELRPMDTLTRAEAAKVLYILLSITQ